LGEPPEIDAIAGPILRGAHEHGLDATATNALVDQVLARVGQAQLPVAGQGV
jgi:ketopantoate reductase